MQVCFPLKSYFFDHQGRGIYGGICLYGRMSAGLICVAACVMGVFCAIVWRIPWLCAPFGLGTFCGIYLTFLASNYSHLKTFEKENKQFQSHLKNLKGRVADHRSENRYFKESNRRLNLLLIKIQNTNTNYKSLLEEHRKENGRLTKLNDSFSKIMDQRTSHLQDLNSSLTDLKKVTNSDHNLFEKQLNTFKKQLEFSKSQHTKWIDVTEHANSSMELQTEVFLKTEDTLKSIFQSIQEWKDDEHVQRQIDHIQSLQRSIESLNNQLQSLTRKLGHTKGRIETLEKHLESLFKIKEGFEQALCSLLEKIKLLGEKTEDLEIIKQDLLKVTQIFKEFKLNESSFKS